MEYIGDGLMKGSKFTGQVGKYYRSSVKRSKGIVLDQGGELMVEITWRDAPSQFAKSCVGKADNFKVDDFLVNYKVRKIERIAISNNVAVAAISNSTIAAVARRTEVVSSTCGKKKQCQEVFQLGS